MREKLDAVKVKALEMWGKAPEGLRRFLIAAACIVVLSVIVSLVG